MNYGDDKMTDAPTDRHPLVSICIAARNEENYISDTLRSIQEQTHENFEVLIFDNDSTDETPAICEDFCTTDKRFNLYRNTFNVGQTYNFTRCLTPARGDYVAIRSGNDLLRPQYLEKTLAILLDSPETGMAYSRSDWIDEEGKPLDSDYQEDSFFETDCTDPVAAAETVLRCYIHPASYFGVYRKGMIDRLQPMRHAFGGEKMFVCEASLYGNIRCVKEPLFIERKHQRQASLAHIFSQDAVYGLPDDSIFASFEATTPFTDMIWGFNDMFARASLEPDDKAQLCVQAHRIFAEHYREQLNNEKQRLLEVFNENRDHLAGERAHLVHMRHRHNFLYRVMRMRFISPKDEELKSLANTVSEAL
jgi:glycosyltransferase involved in cell wall biosynthesis